MMAVDKHFSELRQGDIIFLDFNPTKGHEQKGYRPCIVLTKPLRYLNYMFGVAPITTKAKQFPLHVSLTPEMHVQGEVLLEQHRMLDLETRSFKFVERAPIDLVTECTIKLKLMY